MPEKRRRQAAILKRVREHAVSSQEELVEHLENVGIHATQASVSRDVRELGLVKADGRYLPAGRLNGRRGSEPVPAESEFITSVEPVGANLIVVRTRIGAASAVAVDLDGRLTDEIAGTIAGDDTVFIAVRSRAAQGRVMARLRELTPQA